MPARGDLKPLSAGAAWIGGEIVPIAEAKIGVTDWGFTHSDCVYDVVPFVSGAFFRLPEYVARLQASIATGQFHIAQQPSAIRDIMHQLVAATGLSDAYCAMVVAREQP